MARAELMNDLLAIEGIIDDRFFMEAPSGPIGIVAGLCKPVPGDRLDERLGRIQRGQRQVLRFGEGYKGLIIFEWSAPVVSPVDLFDKRLPIEFTPPT